MNRFNKTVFFLWATVSHWQPNGCSMQNVDAVSFSLKMTDTASKCNKINKNWIRK